MSVAEPFGSEPPPEIDLDRFCRQHAAVRRADTAAEVWSGQQRLLTGSGEEIYYDALLLATGARQRDALPGARAFRGAADVAWFAALIQGLERGSVRDLTFAAPAEVRWTLPLYELALMTAQWLGRKGESRARLSFVTAEPRPLAVLGEAVGERVEELLGEHDIELVQGPAPVRFEHERLIRADGSAHETHHVVSLPALWVPDLPGVPQGRRGFIGCDPEMRVDGLQAVWAAGDATWFPIKQGGIAAQQAEVAASSIAAAAGLRVRPEPFRPVVRGALLTGGEPLFLRGEVGEDAVADISTSPLWWPPTKVAGPRLAPLLAGEASGYPLAPATVIEDLSGSEKDEEEHREALRMALAFARSDAREGEVEDALRWLDVAERLNLTLPPRYRELRAEWRQRVGAGGG
jgi:sulfide:quinone oxidoreductase